MLDVLYFPIHNFSAPSRAGSFADPRSFRAIEGFAISAKVSQFHVDITLW